MSEIAQNKRMELIHQIRQEHYQNRRILQNRVGILYGNSVEEAKDEQIYNPFTSFKIRFALALLLFVAFFIMKVQNITLGNMNAQMIHQVICKGMDLSVYLDYLKSVYLIFIGFSRIL